MIIVEITKKGAQLEAIQKLVEKVLAKQYGDANVRVYRKEPPESRSDRFDNAQSLVSDAKLEGEALRDELQNWLDNLPENLQGGDKAGQLEDAISNIEEFIEACDNAESASVDFPGMY
jgi:hypothetical protein